MKFFRAFLIFCWRFLTPIRILVVTSVALFFWFVILGDQGISELRRLFEMKHRLEQERRLLNDDIDRLTEEKKILSDPANLEITIRKELGYIKQGEIVFEERRDDDQR